MTYSGVNAGAWLAFAELAGPILIVLLVIGIGAGVLQTATQIREQSVPFVLKLAGVAVITTTAGSMMLGGVETYATHLISSIPGLIHG